MHTRARYLGVLFLVGLVSVVLYVALPVEAVAPPGLSLSVSDGQVRTTFVATFEGVAPCTRLQLELGGRVVDGSLAVGTPTAETVPSSATVGPTTVDLYCVLVGAPTTLIGSVAFTVDPPMITLDPASGAPGAPFTITTHGFPGNCDTVRFYWDSVDASSLLAAADPPAPPDGNQTAAIVPAGASGLFGGDHTVVATYCNATVSASFRVVPTLVLTPAVGQAGDTFIGAGVGYSGCRRFTLLWDSPAGSSLGTTVVNTNAASDVFTVPVGAAEGPHTVTSSCATVGAVTTATYTVLAAPTTTTTTTTTTTPTSTTTTPTSTTSTSSTTSSTSSTIPTSTTTSTSTTSTSTTSTSTTLPPPTVTTTSTTSTSTTLPPPTVTTTTTVPTTTTSTTTSTTTTSTTTTTTRPATTTTVPGTIPPPGTVPPPTPPPPTAPPPTGPPPTPPPATVPPGTAPPATIFVLPTVTTTTAPPPTTEAPTSVPTTRASRDLKLSQPAAPPGGTVEAVGHGCRAGSTVAISLDGKPAGTTTADGSGEFHAPIALSDVEVGRHQVLANCGIVLTAPLDVVLATSVDGGTSTLAVILFFLVIGLALYRRASSGPAH